MLKPGVFRASALAAAFVLAGSPALMPAATAQQKTVIGVSLAQDDNPFYIAMLRGMVKSRRESVELYKQGNRPELAAKEEAEIAVIESFLPAQMDEAGISEAVIAAIAATGAQGIKDMGKVMAALRASHGPALDMGRAGPIVKARLAM